MNGGNGMKLKKYLYYIHTEIYTPENYEIKIVPSRMTSDKNRTREFPPFSVPSPSSAFLSVEK